MTSQTAAADASSSSFAQLPTGSRRARGRQEKRRIFPEQQQQQKALSIFRTSSSSSSSSSGSTALVDGCSSRVEVAEKFRSRSCDASKAPSRLCAPDFRLDAASPKGLSPKSGHLSGQDHKSFQSVEIQFNSYLIRRRRKQ